MARTAEPVRPAPEESSAVRELDSELHEAEVAPTSLIAPDGRKLELPASVFEVLARVVHEMARGNAVSVVPIGMMLTTQQAAEIVGVSRPYLIRLLESGEIPFEKVGAHRRVRFEDVMAYRRRRDVRRREALRKLTRESERLGIEY